MCGSGTSVHKQQVTIYVSEPSATTGRIVVTFEHPEIKIVADISSASGRFSGALQGFIRGGHCRDHPIPPQRVGHFQLEGKNAHQAMSMCKLQIQVLHKPKAISIAAANEIRASMQCEWDRVSGRRQPKPGPNSQELAELAD